MPGFNQTGPKGLGAMSGRRRGRCANNANGQWVMQTTPVEETGETASLPIQQRGFGVGRGNGVGCQHRFRGGR
jgi:hypothetical protein